MVSCFTGFSFKFSFKGEKMAKLHELLAVEGDLENTFKKTVEEGKTTFTKRGDHFIGKTRTLEMFDEKEQSLNTVDHLNLETTVPKKLEYVFGHIARYFDAVLQKETTNQGAIADLVIKDENGTELFVAAGLPATFLLGLESRLKIVRDMIMTIPTLQPSIEWTHDDTLDKDVWKAVHKEEKFKTAKQFQHQILVAPTKEHPAQIEKWEEQKPVGKYTTETTCGMLSTAQKSNLLARVDLLMREVKKARQRANTTEVVKNKIGKEISALILSAVE
jgi:hypothetical protein